MWKQRRICLSNHLSFIHQYLIIVETFLLIENADCLYLGRPLLRKWILMLFLGTCLLYGARMAMPICVVPMSEKFHWSKIDSGLVLGGFFWGYCFTQILGGHASDR